METKTLESRMRELIEEIEGLKTSAMLRANDLSRSDELREVHTAAVTAYGYCQLRLRMILGDSISAT